MTGYLLPITGNSLMEWFGWENPFFDMDMIIELLILFFICMYGLSGILRFSAFVPRGAGAGSGDFIFFDCIEYIIWFISSLGFFLYAIFISQNIYTTILLIVEIFLIMGRFIYLMLMKRKNYLKQRERWIAVLKERKKNHQHNPFLQGTLPQQKTMSQ